jgi:hypothetical protein
MFQLTMGMAGFGYALFLLNLFAFPSAILVEWSLCMAFYGLYFGVLCRDLIDFASEYVTYRIGVRLSVMVQGLTAI